MTKDELIQPLTDKQLRFCECFVISLNATQAAIEAGYSKKTAKEQGSRLLTKVNVLDKVAELKQQISERNMITADDIVQELAGLGFSNITDFMDGEGNLKDLEALDARKTAAISGLTITKEGASTTVRFRLYNKLDALEKLAKHVGLYEKDNKQKAVSLIPEGLDFEALFLLKFGHKPQINEDNE